MREIVFDTETTGLEPNNGDRLTELGGVEVVDLIPTGRTYHTLINPERDIPAEVTKVTGHTREMLQNEPKFHEVVDGFLEFVGDARIVAHNAKFDQGFINAELIRAGKTPYADDRFFDTLTLARKQRPGAYNSLDALCKHFGISLESREKHGALIDAMLLAEVYLQLNGGRERSLELSSDEAVAKADEAVVTAPLKHPPRPTPLAVKSTDEERAAHAAFVESLGEDAVWKRYLGD